MRDPSAVEASLVALVRELSRKAGRVANDEEARAALAPLSLHEEEILRAQANLAEPPARPLGPMGWADLARGVPAHTAAARELAGYYELQAERDALAKVLRARQVPAGHVELYASASEQLAIEPEPRQVKLAHRRVEKKPAPKASKKAKASSEPRAPATDDQSSRLLTLFAYHRDTPLVAKALGWSLAELDAEVDRLQLRRKTAKLLRGLDTELPAATARRSSTTPVRRRSAKEREETAARQESERAMAALHAAEEAKREAEEARAAGSARKRTPPRAKQSAAHGERRDEDDHRRDGDRDGLPRQSIDEAREKAREAASEAELKKARAEKHPRAPLHPSAAQGDELRAVLREIGPRRHALAARLGSGGKPLSPAALLARFRAAGLEREFGQRERDLIRALISRHRAALGPAAAELSVNKHALEQLIRERGLSREIDEQREQQRTAARASRWPKARIAQLLERRDWLSDLGVLDELEKDARARLKLLWKDLPAGPGRLDSLAAQLGIKPEEARALASQLSLS